MVSVNGKVEIRHYVHLPLLYCITQMKSTLQGEKKRPGLNFYPVASKWSNVSQLSRQQEIRCKINQLRIKLFFALSAIKQVARGAQCRLTGQPGIVLFSMTLVGQRKSLGESPTNMKTINKFGSQMGTDERRLTGIAKKPVGIRVNLWIKKKGGLKWAASSTTGIMAMKQPI